MSEKGSFYCDLTALHPEVTGSCFLLAVHYPNGQQTIFLVDFGMFQEEKYSARNNIKIPFDPEKVEFVLITHNHSDHMGRLAMLSKEGFRGRVYATHGTKRLMPVSLYNSFQIMKDDARLKKSKPLYEKEDVEEICSNIRRCGIEETVYVNKNIKITYCDNGHLLGAGMILVQISYPGYEDINLFFSGDYKLNNVFREHIRPIPEWITNLPVTLVTESTYGYMESSEVKYTFEDNLVKVLQEGKKVVIFVFAQGRAQEVLLCIKDLQKSGKLSKKIPIRLDGNLSQVYTNIYSKYDFDIDEDKRDFIPENFEYVTFDNREEVLNSNEQQIVLTTSGMADHGPAQIYVPRFVGRSDYAFFFTGYTSEGTLGYKLKNPVNGKVKIKGEELEVKAQVYTTNQWSAHAKADELEEKLIKSFKQIKLLLVNHGQKDVQRMFAQRLESKGLAKRVEIAGEHTFRINHYGCTKIMGSKLYTQESENKKHEKLTGQSSRRRKDKPKYQCRKKFRKN